MIARDQSAERREALARCRQRRREGLEAINLLGNGGWEMLRTLLSDLVHGPGCPDDAPCRVRARRVLAAMGKGRGRRGGTWTQTALREMRRRWEASKSSGEMHALAAEFGTNLKALRLLARKHGWTQDPRGYYWSEDDLATAERMCADGETWEAISRAVGRSTTAVRQKATEQAWRRSNGGSKPWTEGECRLAWSMRQKGTHSREIAKALGRPHRGTQHKLTRMARAKRAKRKRTRSRVAADAPGCEGGPVDGVGPPLSARERT